MPAPSLALPPALDAVIARAESRGVAILPVGRALQLPLERVTPREFELWCVAPQDGLRALFPHAVTGVDARRLLLPSEAGPIDLYALPHRDALEAALGRRDFRSHAIAYRPREAEFVDPFDGLGDIERRCLRSVGDPVAMLAADPLRALRAVAVSSRRGLVLDPKLADALSSAAQPLKARSTPFTRQELEAILLGPRVRTAIETLRSHGLEAALVPGAREDAPRVIEALPLDLTLRWTAWLRDTAVVLLLRRLRMPRDRGHTIERWLQRHPVDAGNAAALASRARRLLHRDASDREPLLALRRAEIAAHAGEHADQLDRLEAALARQREIEAREARRQRLALDGSQVMAHLGCRPGAHVGEALRHLSEIILEDPSANEPARLRAELDRWWANRRPAT